MEIVSGLTISGEAICLDEKHFIDCTLKGCQLIYSGGGVIFERTRILQCRHVFHDCARATVLYLQSVGLMENEAGKWTEYAESVN